MRTSLLAATVGALAAIIVAMPAAAADIDTTTGGIAFNIQPFGAPNTATYGQTFTAGGSSLTSFSLYLNGRVGGSGPLDLKGYVGTWDGSKLGTLLYSSNVRAAEDTGLTEFAFSTGSIAMTAGSTYVAFLSVSDLAEQSTSLFFMPSAVNDIAGGFVFLNNSTDFSALGNDDWESFGTRDVFFKAGFDGVGGVPEPASWTLMIAGFGLVGAGMRRRTAAIA